MAERQHPGQPATRIWRLLTNLYWLWPGLLMLAIGLVRLGRPALWADELATWGAVRLSWTNLIHLLDHVDGVLAPYYVLEKAWTTVVGTSTVALRLPSVLAMTAGAMLTAVLGARLATVLTGGQPAMVFGDRPGEVSRSIGNPRWAGFLAGLTFVIIPVTSRYAQEARSYALEMTFSVLATLLLARLIERPRWGRAAPYALSVALTGAMHLIGLLLLAAHLVAVLAWITMPAPSSGPTRTAGTAQPIGPAQPAAPAQSDRGRVLRLWMLAALAALAMLAPLAWWAHGQREQLSWIEPAHWRDLVHTPVTLFGTGVVGGAIVILAVLGLLALAWPGRLRWPTALLAAWAVVPTLALYLISLATPAYWPRYLLFTVPAYVLLTALGLARLGQPGTARTWPPPRQESIIVTRLGHWVRPIIVLAVLALLAAPGQAAIRGPSGHNHATAQAAHIIAAHERPGDAIVYALHEPVVPWEARDIVARYVPPDRRPDDVFALTPQRTNGHLLADECSDLTACLDRAAPQRIWLLRFEHHTDPLAGLSQPKKNLLRSRYHITKIWPVRGLTVALLTLH